MNGIASIALGISVNGTTHLMFRFKHELAATPDDPDDAVRRMLLAVGRPVVGSSLILMAGFAVLLFASVKSVDYFGLLSCATIASALLAEPHARPPALPRPPPLAAAAPACAAAAPCYHDPG